ncbi:trypco2 family protein [Glycomyces tenuis]|uniref:trypco2 family protein n=1 Tax=Glycomyces tenuis TaxID=58116 RepID=UPI0003FACB14|nr:trypco2 family protein [Glycomyces tenuis]
MEPIPLSSALAEIRRELKIAKLTSDEELKLEVQEVELELTMDLGEVKRKDGGISLFNVVSFNGGKDENSANQHRIKLVLKPTFDEGDGGGPSTLNLSASEPIDD